MVRDAVVAANAILIERNAKRRQVDSVSEDGVSRQFRASREKLITTNERQSIDAAFPMTSRFLLPLNSRIDIYDIWHEYVTYRKIKEKAQEVNTYKY